MVHHCVGLYEREGITWLLPFLLDACLCFLAFPSQAWFGIFGSKVYNQEAVLGPPAPLEILSFNAFSPAQSAF